MILFNSKPLSASEHGKVDARQWSGEGTNAGREVTSLSVTASLGRVHFGGGGRAPGGERGTRQHLPSRHETYREQNMPMSTIKNEFERTVAVAVPTCSSIRCVRERVFAGPGVATVTMQHMRCPCGPEEKSFARRGLGTFAARACKTF